MKPTIDEINKIYKEVKVVMSQLELFDRLPKEIQKTINDYADDEYVCKFSLEEGFDENTISKEAYGIVILLYLTYISNDENEMREFKEIIMSKK